MIKLKGIRCLLKVGFKSGVVDYLKCNREIFLLYAPWDKIDGNYIYHFMYFCLFERTKQQNVEHLVESRALAVLLLLKLLSGIRLDG